MLPYCWTCDFKVWKFPKVRYVQWDGIPNHLSMAYLLSNICTKSYWNLTTIVEIIVGGWVVSLFWDTVYLAQLEAKIEFPNTLYSSSIVMRSGAQRAQRMPQQMNTMWIELVGVPCVLGILKAWTFCTQDVTRHRASTSMYSLTFCVRVMSPERHHWKLAVQAAR